MKVGYLGPKGTFSYDACNSYCKKYTELVEYKTILDTIITLENEKIDEAVVQIENSLLGCVTHAIDTLQLKSTIYYLYIVHPLHVKGM